MHFILHFRYLCSSMAREFLLYASNDCCFHRERDGRHAGFVDDGRYEDNLAMMTKKFHWNNWGKMGFMFIRLGCLRKSCWECYFVGRGISRRLHASFKISISDRTHLELGVHLS